MLILKTSFFLQTNLVINGKIWSNISKNKFIFIAKLRAFNAPYVCNEIVVMDYLFSNVKLWKILVEQI